MVAVSKVGSASAVFQPIKSVGAALHLPYVALITDHVMVPGILVVNVKWRGRTYVGTLFDSSRQPDQGQNRY